MMTCEDKACATLQAWTNEGGEDTSGLDWYQVAESCRRFSEILSNQLVDIDEAAFYLDTGARIEFNEECREWRVSGDWLDVVHEFNLRGHEELLDLLVADGCYGLATVLMSEVLPSQAV